MLNQQRMEGQDNSRRKNRRRLLLFCSVGTGAFIAAWLLSAALYMRYQGASLIKYCNDSLIGKSSNQMVVAAREAGFEALEVREMILLTMPGKRHGRTCYLLIDNDAVADVDSAFSW